MAILGPAGLERVALTSHTNLLALLDRLEAVTGVSRRFSSPVFHEAVLSLSAPAARVLDRLRSDGLLAGFDLRSYYPELGDAILVCTTETKSAADLDRYARSLGVALAPELSAAAP
jgi:glycine dehydrogenase subunit 1